MGGGSSVPTGKSIHKFIEKQNVAKLKKALEEYGAEVLLVLSCKNDEGRTPLLAAMHQGYSGVDLEMILLLIEAAGGIDEANKYKQTPLIVLASAPKQKNLDIIQQKLIQKGAFLEATDKNGMTALHKVCSSGHLDLALDLIEAGADLKKKDNYGFTPLHYAAQKRQYILSIGADLKEKTNDGKTPVLFAIESGQPSTLAQFTRYGGFRTKLQKVEEGQYSGERCDPWMPKYNNVKECTEWEYIHTGDIIDRSPYKEEADVGYDSEDEETGASEGKKVMSWLEDRKQKVALANMGIIGKDEKSMKKFSWQIGVKRRKSAKAWHSAS